MVASGGLGGGWGMVEADWNGNMGTFWWKRTVLCHDRGIDYPSVSICQNLSKAKFCALKCILFYLKKNNCK